MQQENSNYQQEGSSNYIYDQNMVYRILKAYIKSKYSISNLEFKASTAEYSVNIIGFEKLEKMRARTEDIPSTHSNIAFE